ncbi:ribosomal RNA small subunit methyltransferase F [Escherichia coli]|uniref:Ribosomal RNA small subunit methyltransferase F n=1 Tax=Escherichia coli TaxID=562 RepID=A0A376U8U1_ECOLX|nr:ribosomal RNA small subunit methyltransferase F [Escherichia coli]
MPISAAGGISNVALTPFDGRVFGAAVPEMFDAILLDAPCSGEGVVRKDPDALKNWSPESNQEIASYTTGAYRQRLSCITSWWYAGLLDLYLKPGRKTKPFACG